MSGSLNVRCAICFEFYKPTDTVYSTGCGHVFHRNCIFACLQNSHSCPECRRPCLRANLHRIFLNYGERTEADDQIESQYVFNTPIWVPLPEADHPGPEDPLTDGIKIGTDPDGNETFVSRVYFQDDLLPAGYAPLKGFAYASHGCRSLNLRNGIEILLNGNYEWKESSNGHVPSGAIVAGYSEIGEDLYIGRATYEGITLLGKVHPSHKVMYMPYKEKEVNSSIYEVLVCPSSTSQGNQSGHL